MKLKEKIPEKSFFVKGHACCKGCGLAIAVRHILNTLEPSMVVNPACCFTVTSSNFPGTALKNCYLEYVPFAMAVPIASGIKIGLRGTSKGDKALVVPVAGDGGTYDIGFDKLSAGAEREDDMVYVCYDNEAYMNTGVQRSGATPKYAATVTTPPPFVKTQFKKDIIGILERHRVSYAATLNFAFPADFAAKIKKAKEMKGFRFLLVLVPCSPGWKFSPELTVKISRLASESGIFPLYEVESGKYRITVQPKDDKNRFEKLKEYLAAQGRFKHLNSEQIKEVYEDARVELRRLKRMEKLDQLGQLGQLDQLDQLD